MTDILIPKKSEARLDVSSDNAFRNFMLYYDLLRKELERRPWNWIVACSSICDFWRKM